MKIIHFSDPTPADPPRTGSPMSTSAGWASSTTGSAGNSATTSRNCAKRSNTSSTSNRTRAVCTGDLTSTGQPGEFELVRPVLEPLRNSTIPLFYLPGNHDCYVKRPKCVRAVREMVHFLSRGDYEFTDLPVRRSCGGVEFLLVNTSRPSNLLCSWGFFDRKDAEWVARACDEPANAPRILVTHYPMIEHHPILRMRHRLFGQKRILELMRNGKIALTLCGHVHRPYLEVDRDGHGECCAGSVTRNGTMMEIDADPASDRFEFKTITL